MLSRHAARYSLSKEFLLFFLQCNAQKIVTSMESAKMRHVSASPDGLAFFVISRWTTGRRLCSNHGNLNQDTQKCACDAQWTGDSCDTGTFIVSFFYLHYSHSVSWFFSSPNVVEVCTPACGMNGDCQNSRCICKPGWTGLICDSPQCPACGTHGKCSNGSCLCEKGWSGRLCTIGEFLIDWLMDWLIEWWIACLIAWLIDWGMLDWLMDAWLIDWLMPFLLVCC